MPLHNFQTLRGRIERLTIDSRCIANNMLGDPATREIQVYLPQGYDASERHYPLLVFLAGFTGSGQKLLSWQSFGESVPQRIDRLVESGAMGPVISVFPDTFTSLGGNQYVNSAALGNWDDFLRDEMIPAVEGAFRVCPGAAHRAVLGKSSGGYGSIVQGLLHGDFWGAIACHSGDMGFNWCYRPDFPKLLSQLARHENDIARFVAHVARARKISSDEFYALMLLAMGASYDPDPSAPLGLRLPVDPYTCELDGGRWSAWLEHDPLRMIERNECQASLRRLSGLFIDCGSADQYNLQYPARAFARRLEGLSIEHVYEEFDDNHSGLDYRMDRSLPFLRERIAAPGD